MQHDVPTYAHLTLQYLRLLDQQLHPRSLNDLSKLADLQKRQYCWEGCWLYYYMFSSCVSWFLSSPRYIVCLCLVGLCYRMDISFMCENIFHNNNISIDGTQFTNNNYTIDKYFCISRTKQSNWELEIRCKIALILNTFCILSD